VLIPVCLGMDSCKVYNPRSTLSNRSPLHPLRTRDPTSQVGPVSSSLPFKTRTFLTRLPLSSRYVIANDLSPDAVAAMKRNVNLNKLGPSEASTSDMQVDTTTDGTPAAQINKKAQEATKGKVRVNEGDAWQVHWTLCNGRDTTADVHAVP
jgi:hypothetical protein